MSQYLLIDGHSVIFHWAELRKLHSQNPRKGREELSKQVELLHDCGKWRVTLVFDGRRGVSSPVVDERRMLILYSEEDQTADSVIEKIVGQQKDRSNIAVITADEAERLTIEALGARVFSPEWLLEEVKTCGVDVGEQLKRVHKKAKW